MIATRICCAVAGSTTSASTRPAVAMDRVQKTSSARSSNCPRTASWSAFMAYRMIRGRKTKSGRNTPAGPIAVSGSVAMPANQKPAGTTLIVAGGATSRCRRGRTRSALRLDGRNGNCSSGKNYLFIVTKALTQSRCTFTRFLFESWNV